MSCVFPLSFAENRLALLMHRRRPHYFGIGAGRLSCWSCLLQVWTTRAGTRRLDAVGGKFPYKIGFVTNNIYNPTSCPVDPRVPWLSGDAALTARTHLPAGPSGLLDGAQLANSAQAPSATSAQAAAARRHTAGGRPGARQQVRERLHPRLRWEGVVHGNLRAMPMARFTLGD